MATVWTCELCNTAQRHDHPHLQLPPGWHFLELWDGKLKRGDWILCSQCHVKALQRMPLRIQWYPDDPPDTLRDGDTKINIPSLGGAP